MAEKRRKARAGARRTAGRAAMEPARSKRRQPERLRLQGATPGYTVSDIAKSLAWYRDVLGCVVEERWETEGKLLGASMRAGNVRIFLGQDDWKQGRDRKKGEGFRIYCTVVQDVDKLAARIKARGGTLTHEPRDEPWGERDFGVVDPDGFKITISRARH